MKKMISLLIFALMGLPSVSNAETIFRSFKISGAHDNGILFQGPSKGFSKGPGVAGHAFVSMDQVDVKLNDCNKIIISFEELVRKPIESAGFFLDFGVMCFPNGAGSTVAYNYVTEPWDVSQVAAFDSLILSLQGKKVGEIAIEFLPIHHLEDQQHFTVADRKTHQKPSVDITKTVTYSSIVPNYAAIESELASFQIPVFEKFKSYLNVILPANDAFRVIQALEGTQLTLTSMHTPTVTLNSGKVITSNMSIGSNRFCDQEETPCQ